MKIRNSTMSHNVCDVKSRRWLVNIFDVVEIDTSLCGEGVYFGYVSMLSSTHITVIRIKDCKEFIVPSFKANEIFSVTRRCSDVVVAPYEFRSDVKCLSVGQSVVDMTFDGDFEWYISKFDLSTFRAFVYRTISGRTIGHWADIWDLVDATNFKE